MRTLTAAKRVLVAALAGQIAFGTQIANAGPATPTVPQANPTTVTIRATGELDLTRAMVRAIADVGAPTRLSRDAYPEAGRFSARQVAQILCGSLSDLYLTLMQTRNNLPSDGLDTPLGDRVYDIAFPACLNVEHFDKAKDYVVQPGDTYATIRQTFTGVQGTDASNAYFFGVSKSRIAGGLPAPGAVLKIPYMTSTITLPAIDANDVFSAVASHAGARTGKYILQAPPTPGKIVSFMHDNVVSSAPVTPPDCGSEIVHPFVAQDVIDAFGYSMGEAEKANANPPYETKVIVVDNGFFGARPGENGDPPIFSEPQFTLSLFDTTTFHLALGPLTGDAPNIIYPMNRANDKSPDGPLSGHGTHVTGLVIGGPDVMDQRDKLLRPKGDTWLQLAELNIGNASDQLIPGAERDLRQQLLLLPGERIVNMSISFDASDPNTSSAFAFMNADDGLANSGGHLYVVSAGNDSRSADYYFPAAAGGVERSTRVVTVAALAPSGALATFTNTGLKADVAAPGCNIASWIDDKSTSAPLSGTSQAAPIVSFEGALIRGLTGVNSVDLKQRIIASGDLLSPDDQPKISGHVKVDVVKALYVFDDYVEYRDPDDPKKTVRLLGNVADVGTLECSDGHAGISMSTLLSYKSDGKQAYGYFKDTTGRLTVCPLKPSLSADVLTFAPRRRVASGYPVPLPADVRTPPMSTVIDVTMHLVQRIRN